MPGWRDWLFSAKAFLAAALALGVGMAAGLDRPYWAMASVYIASQPLSGATRSKALFRVLGTLLGAAAAVALVPTLANAPVLLVGAVALWTAVCLGLALLDRTPRSYVFMLAAYSLSIIGLPSVDAPAGVWDVAVARSEEIVVGIVCASLVQTLIFPRHVGPALGERIGAWLAEATGWGLDVLEGRETADTARASRRSLVAGIAELDALAGHLGHDPSVQAQALGSVRLLRSRMLMLLPLLSSLSDRLTALRQAGPLPRAAEAVVGRVVARLRRSPADPELEAATAALAPADQRDWSSMLLVDLSLRLRELVELQSDCEMLHRAILTGCQTAAPLRYRASLPAPARRHQDWVMAAFSGGAAGLAVAITCTLWIQTGWPEGFIAAEMVAVVCCFFATMDDPVPAILGFLRWTVMTLVIDAVYLFAVLPLVHDFVPLLMVLAPPFLIFGVLAARPETAPIGLALAANGATLLSLGNVFSADFGSYLNAAVATVLGMVVGTVVTAIVRSVGAEWSAHRLWRLNWRDMARAAERRGRSDRAAFAALLLDRFATIVPRLRSAAPEAALHQADALAELRIGLNLVDLRAARHGLAPAERAAMDTVLDGMARYCWARYRQAGQLGGDAPWVTTGALVAAMDAALAQLAQADPAPGRAAGLQGLLGLRRGLAPGAPAFSPLPPALAASPQLEHAA